MNKPERSSYTPLDFLEWHETQALVLTPKFQRRGVWTDAARSSLIDTLIQGMPVPPIYLRVRQSDDKKRIVREVVDGQQRVGAVIGYLQDEFRLSKSLDESYAKKKFSELEAGCKDQIRQFSFNCEVFQGVSDTDILEVFRRLNTYSIPLNNQELRNGKYFGFFKQSAYRLAYNHVEFWRSHKIFSERSIARMLEVEFTSELMIAQLDGLQDKKKSINGFYEEYEDSFSDQRRVESRFGSTVDAIELSVGDILKDSEFARPPLFYSLFCAMYHRIYGLPRFKEATHRRPLNTDERAQLGSAVAKLSEVVESAKQDGESPPKFSRFVTACLRQTDNVEPRLVRLQTLYNEAF